MTNSLIDYTIAEAGGEIMLVLQHRPGRGPVDLVQMDPALSWRCADGAIETLGRPLGDGAQQAGVSYDRMVAAIRGEGLLVAEFLEATPSWEPARTWVLGPDGEIPEGQSQEVVA